ncbi:MAG: hypothetical protein ABI867_41360 [Kofleriaceae bacterium]
MRITLAVLVSVSGSAGAQPGLVAPNDSPAARLTVAARTAARNGDCATVENLRARVYELDRAYYAQMYATDPTLVNCRPRVAVVAEPVDTRTTTIEAAVGLGRSQFIRGGLIDTVGLALGIGAFLSPKLAITFRVTATYFGQEELPATVGVVGPNLQLWPTDHVSVGAGIGMGMVINCDPCETEAAVGWSLRLGYAFRPRGHSGGGLTVEVIAPNVPGQHPVVALQLGYQTF